MVPKTIVITGASDGLGAAAARELTSDGRKVVLVGRPKAKQPLPASWMPTTASRASPISRPPRTDARTDQATSSELRECPNVYSGQDRRFDAERWGGTDGTERRFQQCRSPIRILDRLSETGITDLA